MTHYEVLGVARDASPEQIKAAFRKASSAAHPDRQGGSHERMLQVNRAHDVLSDPERRARYDATGSDAVEPTLDLQARNMMMTALQQVMQQDGNWVAMADRSLADHVSNQAPQARAQIQARIAMLRKRSGKFRTKAQENLAQGLIEQQIRDLEAALGKIEHEAKVIARARELLKEYEADPEPVMVQTFWGASTSSTTGMWG